MQGRSGKLRVCLGLARLGLPAYLPTWLTVWMAEPAWPATKKVESHLRCYSIFHFPIK